MKLILGLDLSTTCTGWALSDPTTKKLKRYGKLSPTLNIKKRYPWGSLERVLYMVGLLKLFLDKEKSQIDKIVIEEVNKHRNRIQGKVLDSLHFFLLNYLKSIGFEGKVFYLDSDGAKGWRSRYCLGLQLTDQDKIINRQRRILNKEIKAKNKRLKRGEKEKEFPLINKKHLACRFVNHYYKKNFDYESNESHGDICDAIGLNHAFIHYFL